MKKSPRHEVISLRLNEDRLKLLVRAREALTNQLGRQVSLAEAAFLVLEDRAVGMDRNASRFEMLENPTASLDRIRKQWESQHTLSAAEWDVIAYYVEIGAEEERHEPPRLWPAIPSRESSLALLDAFEAVYQKRQAPASQHVWTYFGNLDGYGSGSATLSHTDAGQRHQVLLDLIAKQRHALRTNDPWYAPHLGRCFWLAIREEGVDSVELDHALAVYWPTLWGLAARGHWIRHGQPVRAAGLTRDLPHHVPIPNRMTVGDCTISFTPHGGPDFATSVGFRGTRRLSMSIFQYPELVEFHAMLDGAPDRPWHGKYFRAVVSDNDPGGRLLCIKRFEVGVELSEREWDDLRTLVRQAWQHPELQPWLAELQKEYGEQGEGRDGEAQ